MSEAPRISVVVATYNCADTLHGCLQSVVEQNVALELIVVDGASGDRTLAILEQYRPHIAYLVSESDGGVYHALNKGLAHARCEFLYVLGSDDRLAHPRALAGLLAAADDADVVYGDVVVKDVRGRLRASSALPLARFPYEMPFSHQAALVRRSLALRHPFGSSLASDYRQLYALYLAGARFRRVPGCVAIYALGGLSDRRQVASTYDRLRINLALRGRRAAAVVPFYVLQIGVCWIKPKLMRLLHLQGR
jgi:glycosyltransferase involved in cell wall biosynthesis